MTELSANLPVVTARLLIVLVITALSAIFGAVIERSLYASVGIELLTIFEPDIGSNADELKIYVDLGMKPMDAIMTITKNAAEALHIDKELGTLDEGKLADVVLVKGNPAENIEVLGKRENILMFLKEGKICVDRSNGKDVKPFPTDYMECKMMD